MKHFKAILNFFPLICIYAGETAKLAFFFELKKIGHEANLFESMLMSLSLFCVPAIGWISDKNCRKKTLIFTLIGGLLALWFLKNNNFFASFIQGTIGAAVVPIARAMHLDINSRLVKNWKTSILIVETVIVQALAWSLSSLYGNFDFTYIAIALFAVVIVLVSFLRDVRDNDSKIVKHELSSVRRRYLEGFPWQLLVAFFLYDCAFQLPNYYSEVFYDDIRFSKILFIVGSGILIGSLVVWFGLALYHSRLSSTSEATLCVYRGILLTSVGMLLVYLYPFLKEGGILHPNVDQMTFFSFCCTSGIMLSLTFVYFGSRVTIHERGLLFCIIEEIETLAEAIVPMFIFYLPASPYLTNMPFIIIIVLGILCIFRKPKFKKGQAF